MLASRIKKQGFLIYEILISLVIVSVVAATLLPYLSQSKKQIINKVQNRNCEDSLNQFVGVLQSEPLLKGALGAPVPGSPIVSTSISGTARPASEVIQPPSAAQSPFSNTISTYTGFFPTAVGTSTASPTLSSVADELASHSILNLTGLMPDLTKLYNSRRADVCLNPNGVVLTAATIDSQLFPASTNTNSPIELSAQIKRAFASAERGGSQFEIRMRLVPYDLVTGAIMNTCPANVIPRPFNRMDPPYNLGNPNPEIALPELLGPESEMYGLTNKNISRIPNAYQRNVGYRVQLLGRQTTPEGQIKTCTRNADFRYPPDFRGVPTVASLAPRVAVLDYFPRGLGGHYDALGGPPGPAYTNYGNSGRPQCSANGARPAYPLQNLMIHLRVGYFGGNALNMTPPTVGAAIAPIQAGTTALIPGTRLLCRDSSLPIYNNWCSSAPEASVPDIASQSGYLNRGWVPCDQVTVCGVQQASPAVAHEGPGTLAYDLFYNTSENAPSTLSGCEVRMDVASLDPLGNIVTTGHFKSTSTASGLPLIAGQTQGLVNNNATRVTFRPPECFQCQRVRSRFGLAIIAAVALVAFGPAALALASYSIGAAGLVAGGLCAGGSFGACRGSQSAGESSCENKSGQRCGRRCRWSCTPRTYNTPIHWGQAAVSTKRCAASNQTIADPQGLGRTIVATFPENSLAGSAPGIYYAANSITVNNNPMSSMTGDAGTFHSSDEALACTSTLACVDPNPQDPDVPAQWQPVPPSDLNQLATTRCENLLTRTRAMINPVGALAPIRSTDIVENTADQCYIVAEQDQQATLTNFSLSYYRDFTNVGLAASQPGSPPECLSQARVLCRIETPADPSNGTDATYAYPIDIQGTLANIETNLANPTANARVPVLAIDPNRYFIYKYSRPAATVECPDQPNPSFNP